MQSSSTILLLIIITMILLVCVAQGQQISACQLCVPTNPHHHRGNGVPVDLTGEALKNSEMSLVILDAFPANGLIFKSDVTLDLRWIARSYWAVLCSLPGSSWEFRPAQEPDGKGIGTLWPPPPQMLTETDKVPPTK